MAEKPYPKIGLALGSGGAKGLAHIGVIKTLNKHNIPIDYIAGTSVGAMLGAYYAAHKDAQRLEELILNFNRKKGFELFDFTVKGGFFKGKKTERFLSEILEGAEFDSLKIPFAAVATDINTAEAVIFREGNIVKAIRASISVPAFYQPLLYKDRLLADGGLSNPVPSDVTYAMGADITIAVNLDRYYLKEIMRDIPALTRIPMHSISILRHNLAIQSVKTADVVISPKDIFQIGLVGWNYIFDNEKAKQIIKVGEDAAEEAVPEIKLAIKAYQYRQTRIGRLLTFFQEMRKKSRGISFKN